MADCPPIHDAADNGRNVPEGDIRGANSNTDRNSSEVVSSFDHLVDARQERRGDRKAECLGGLKIDHQLELGRLRYR
jgi:hypothetical protein